MLSIIGAISLVCVILFAWSCIKESFVAFLGLIVIGGITLFGISIVLSLCEAGKAKKNAEEQAEMENNRKRMQLAKEANETIKKRIDDMIDNEFDKPYPNYPDFKRLQAVITHSCPSDCPDYGLLQLSLRANLLKRYVSVAYDRGDARIAADALALYKMIQHREQIPEQNNVRKLPSAY